MTSRTPNDRYNDDLTSDQVLEVWDDIGANRLARRQRSRWPWVRWYWNRKFDRWVADIFKGARDA